MSDRKKTVPFGLLFEETAPQPCNLMTPIYDEETDIAYVEDSKGRRSPYVEFAGTMGTETATKVETETPDEDPEDYVSKLSGVMGTDTITAVEAETTDTDPEDDHTRSFSSLGTETMTRVQLEAPDEDSDNPLAKGIRTNLYLSHH